MSEDVYAKPELTRKVRFQASSEDKKVEVERNTSDEIIYDNYLPEGSSMSTSQENLTEERQPSTTTPVSKRCGQTALKVAALLLLGLLLLVFLAAVIILATFWTLDGNNAAERETFSSEQKNLSDKLTAQTRLWDQVRGTVYNLTQKMNHLEKYKYNLTAMMDNLTSEVEDLRDEIQAKEARLCAANWTHFGRSCYFISTSNKTWFESNRTCKSYQANLVIISNEVEQMFLNSFELQVWIGLSNVGTSILTDWEWVNGSQLTTEYWGTSEPSNQGNGKEKCGQIKNFDSLNSWNNAECNLTFRFICEKIVIL